MMLFSTTYPSVTKIFSTYVYTGNGYNDRLQVQSDLQFQLSNIDPNVLDWVSRNNTAHH